MGFGLGIVLLVVGLIFLLEVVDLPANVDDVIATTTLGWILVLCGALAILLGLVTTLRARRTHVEERRTEV